MSDDNKILNDFKMVSYYFKGKEGGARFQQYAKDPLPRWASDVKEEGLNSKDILTHCDRSHYAVLTSNVKKAVDFQREGFSVEEYQDGNLEVQDDNVATVALYKALGIDLDNIIVEDTALHVKGSTFSGTDIKHLYGAIKDDATYHGSLAVWEVSICMKTSKYCVIISDETSFILDYPPTEKGYHFEHLIAQSRKGVVVKYPDMLMSEQQLLSPRIKALKRLSAWLGGALDGGITVVPVDQVPEWKGIYQEEGPRPISNKKVGVN